MNPESAVCMSFDELESLPRLCLHELDRLATQLRIAHAREALERER